MIRTGLIWSVPILLIMGCASAYAWNVLPNGVQIPIHWNAQGEVDGYSGKFEALLIMPLVTIFVVVLMSFLPKVDPRKVNLEKSRMAYLAGWIGTMAVLAGVHLLTIYTALGGNVPVANIVYVMIGFLFVALGNYIAKTRSNWFVGLRTPWTLSSEHAWMVGNRYLGYGMLVTGIMMVFSALVSNMAVLLILSLVGVAGSAFVATIASYYAWKNDPEAKPRS